MDFKEAIKNYPTHYLLSMFNPSNAATSVPLSSEEHAAVIDELRARGFFDKN